MQEMREMRIWFLGSGISTGEGNGNPLLYSCLENPMDRGAWWAAFLGVTKRHNWATEHMAHRCLLMSLEESRANLTISFRQAPSKTINWPSSLRHIFLNEIWALYFQYCQNKQLWFILKKNEVGLTFLCFHEVHCISQRKKRILIIPWKYC